MVVLESTSFVCVCVSEVCMVVVPRFCCALMGDLSFFVYKTTLHSALLKICSSQPGVIARLC